jgi:hypothetical protein
MNVGSDNHVTSDDECFGLVDHFQRGLANTATGREEEASHVIMNPWHLYISTCSSSKIWLLTFVMSH